MERLLSELQRVGFSQYEARAYVALLRRAPVNGYELSKASGVPRSMIYEVLGKMQDRGAAHAVPSEPVTYAPVPAKELLSRLKRQTDETFGYLEGALESLEQTRAVDVIRHIRGEKQVTNELLSIVEGAEEELWLALWDARIPTFVEPVRRAQTERSVKVFSVLFEERERHKGKRTPARLGRTFYHDYMPPKVVERRLGGHLHIAARDGEEVVIAQFVKRGAWAVKTRDPALVLIATEHIRADVMFDVIVPDVGAERLDALWQNDPDLVHVVTGRSGGLSADEREPAAEKRDSASNGARAG